MEGDVVTLQNKSVLGEIVLGTVLQLFLGFPLLLVLEFALTKTLADPRGYAEVLFSIWLILLPVTNICRGRFALAFGNLVGIVVSFAFFAAFFLWTIRTAFF